MHVIDYDEVQSNFERWIGRVAMGEVITITRDSVPVAVLMPFQELAEAREPGCWAGRVHIAENFDELPEDIARAFNGDGDDLFPSGRVEQSE